MPLLFRSCLPAAFTSSFIHLPWLFWSFLNFEPLLGTIFCLKFFQTLLKIGGGADVCPPGVSRTEDVDREVQCWAYPYPLGRRMMVDTCCYYSGFVYLRFLSAVQGLQKHSWAFLLSRGKIFPVLVSHLGSVLVSLTKWPFYPTLQLYFPVWYPDFLIVFVCHLVWSIVKLLRLVNKIYI